MSSRLTNLMYYLQQQKGKPQIMLKLNIVAMFLPFSYIQVFIFSYLHDDFSLRVLLVLIQI